MSRKKEKIASSAGHCKLNDVLPDLFLTTMGMTDLNRIMSSVDITNHVGCGRLDRACTLSEDALRYG